MISAVGINYSKLTSKMERPQTPFYTTRAILNLFNNALKVNEERVLIDVRGLYVPGNGTEYRGFFYDSLYEEGTESNLTLVTPAIIRKNLTPGKLVEFSCFITRRIDDKGSIRLTLNMSELYNQAEAKISKYDNLSLEIQRTKSNKGYRDFEYYIKSCILESRRPKIVAIIGSTSIIDQDILHALGETINVFELSFVRVNMTIASQVVNALNRLNQGDTEAIIVSRGGGENLQVFDSIEIARAALSLKAIVVTAIGHREDVSLLDKIADRSFITPSALGSFLREVYNRTIEELTHSKGKIISGVEESFRKTYSHELSSLKELILQKDKELSKINDVRIKEQKKNRIYLLVLIFAGISIGFALARVLGRL